MRKFLCVLAMMSIVSLVYAQDTTFGGETVLNKLLRGSYKGTTRLLRSAVTVNDASNPAMTSGIDMNGWRRALVWVDGTVGTQWHVTPLVGDYLIGSYMPLGTVIVTSDDKATYNRISYDSPLLAVSSVIVSNDDMLSFDVYGCDMFNVKLDKVVNGGGGTTVSIYVTPSN